MEEELKNKIKSVVLQLYKLDIDVDIQTPPLREFGNKSTNVAMLLVKMLKVSPMEIAQSIKLKLEEEKYLSRIDIIKPGFINFFFSNQYLSDALLEISTPTFLHVSKFKDKKLIIEHTASNPNKYLHIGHLRNFCIGDSIRRLMGQTDYLVEVQWFNNDQGLQIAKVLWGLQNLESIKMPSFDESVKYDTYCGKIYSASEKYLSTHQELEEDVRKLIHLMEQGDNEIADFAKHTTQEIIKGQLQTISNFDIWYDVIISENALTQSGVLNKVIKELLVQRKIELELEGKNAGCIVIKNLKDELGNNIPDKVLIRSDGTAVYTAKDIALTMWKYGLMDLEIPFIKFTKQSSINDIYISDILKTQEYPRFGHGDFQINVVDIRQSFPLEVVRQSLIVLGFIEQSQNYKHLAYEFVALSKATAQMVGIDISDGKNSYAMSGRKGHEVSIDILLEKMTNEVKLKKNLDIGEASKIASGALRYYMLKYGYNSIITFDMKDALQSDGDTGIYLQYSYVRALSILNKAGEFIKTYKYELDDEKYLILKMYDASDIIHKSVEDYDLLRICTYTFELCKQFSSFYQNVPVITAVGSQKDSRLTLIDTYANLLKQLLNILGIYTPVKM